MGSLFKNIALVVLASLVAVPALAEWVEVTGSASIKDVSYAEAREAARQDAMRQAMLKFGVRLTSHQSMKNGVLVSDELQADSQVRIRREEIREETIDEDRISIVYAADLERVPECPGSDAGKSPVDAPSRVQGVGALPDKLDRRHLGI